MTTKGQKPPEITMSVSQDKSLCEIDVTGNRKTLIDEIEEFRLRNPDKIKEGEPVLRIITDCGYTMEYRTYDDIPEKSVLCSCGNPEHWVIRYSEE